MSMVLLNIVCSEWSTPRLERYCVAEFSISINSVCATFSLRGEKALKYKIKNKSTIIRYSDTDGFELDWDQRMAMFCTI